MEKEIVHTRKTGSPELDYPFQKWYAHTADKGRLNGYPVPGLYLVSVRGTPLNITAMPVSPSLLETIRLAAENPEDAELVNQLTYGKIHSRPRI